MAKIEVKSLPLEVVPVTVPAITEEQRAALARVQIASVAHQQIEKESIEQIEHIRLPVKAAMDTYIAEKRKAFACLTTSLAEVGVTKGDVLHASRRLGYGGRRPSDGRTDFYYHVKEVEFCGDVDATELTPTMFSVSCEEIAPTGHIYISHRSVQRTLDEFTGKVTDNHPFMRKFTKVEVKRRLKGDMT